MVSMATGDEVPLRKEPLCRLMSLVMEFRLLLADSLKLTSARLGLTRRVEPPPTLPLVNLKLPVEAKVGWDLKIFSDVDVMMVAVVVGADLKLTSAGRQRGERAPLLLGRDL